MRCPPGGSGEECDRESKIVNRLGYRSEPTQGRNSASVWRGVTSTVWRHRPSGMLSGWPTRNDLAISRDLHDELLGPVHLDTDTDHVQNDCLEAAPASYPIRPVVLFCPVQDCAVRAYRPAPAAALTHRPDLASNLQEHQPQHSDRDIGEEENQA